jgi:hypothetical protein
MNPLDIIDPLRKTDPYIQNIFSLGGCYQFYLFLKAIFPDAKPYMHYRKNHVITEIDNRFYDIDGEILGMVDIEVSKIDAKNETYLPFTKEDHKIAKTWSFAGNHLLSAGECKHCGEPILLEAFIHEESIM